MVLLNKFFPRNINKTLLYYYRAYHDLELIRFIFRVNMNIGILILIRKKTNISNF